MDESVPEAPADPTPPVNAPSVSLQDAVSIVIEAARQGVEMHRDALPVRGRQLLGGWSAATEAAYLVSERFLLTETVLREVHSELAGLNPALMEAAGELDALEQKLFLVLVTSDPAVGRLIVRQRRRALRNPVEAEHEAVGRHPQTDQIVITTRRRAALAALVVWLLSVGLKRLDVRLQVFQGDTRAKEGADEVAPKEQRATRTEADLARLAGDFNAISLSDVAGVLARLNPAHRQRLLGDALRSATEEELTVVIAGFNLREWEALSAIFARAEQRQYHDLMLNQERPTISRINAWLTEHCGHDFESDQKILIARAITYFRRLLKARLLTTANGDEVECSISTERLPGNRRRFHLMATGSDQWTIAKRTALPELHLVQK